MRYEVLVIVYLRIAYSLGRQKSRLEGNIKASRELLDLLQTYSRDCLIERACDFKLFEIQIKTNN